LHYIISDRKVDIYMLINKDEEIVGCRTLVGTVYHSPKPAGEIQEILRLSNTPESMNFPK